MAQKGYSLAFAGEPRAATIERCCEQWPEYAAQIRAEQGNHPDELPTLVRGLIRDYDGEIAQYDGFKHFLPSEIRLVWELLEEKTEEETFDG